MEQSFRNITRFFFIQRILKVVNIADTKLQKMERDGICWHTDESPHDWNFLPPGECVTWVQSQVLLQPLLYSAGFLTPLLFLWVSILKIFIVRLFLG